MKKVGILLLVLIYSTGLTFACEMCEKQKPKLLQGIGHGAGPDSNYDYLIIGITVLITVFSLFFAIKWIIKPGEKEQSHIKRVFLEFE
ncbi:MAG: hypothetical protein IE931_08195 [Sphingobacteriales bacterium]|nr:hypothetical protein [Sphingobacteriales bacterium]